MTFTDKDFELAIKNSKSINPFLTYATDWKVQREFNTNNGELSREYHSAAMDETVYVIERNFGLEVSMVKPDTQWAFEIQPYDQWPDYETILFRVYDPEYFTETGHYETEFLANRIKNLIPGCTEVSEGMFINPNFTDHNFLEMMEYENFMNMTPDLGEKPERPEQPEEGCGEDDCCGGSCSSGLTLDSLLDDEDDDIDTTPQPTSLFCPICGTQNVVTNPSQNGGDYLYVAEEYTGNTTEIYDAAYPHKCNNCLTRFYMGDEI